ncbi:type VI secretion system tip protein VgrG [bacterium M00.F.Ca.ET.228.01.1.1]|uniref:type VI secretion system Vgr family protein n=1 Tax=Paraburkholderia phenoliruptrix TaxID=252970 RepID=UPI001093096A|nr:type VI secretion system Vgr family protein [Paraburkholderia phenoliruptrix]TGP43699.1 type VI secretion system tip protein VgrG [bacterium M00.F.Ca.ET.228.01.1.1]TGS01361.1 type VI secretion system tip protein VgrG [bacterium M00.F.Ca.ET.191.01.1.1]TGU09033.1 type VI secretion system tip protein VgrG [bacterium M00.F.Ca.ET.155.01.1.1]MBW0449426.1 type VI secretion system tip protein VgrG [Paraburkholderia phenoliruptrix]MBW9097707.1 type VI secretion system tip protein VgrG [Paraburkholde
MNMTDLVQAIRGGLIQQDRLLKTDIPSLPNDTLVPHRAVTHGELGRDFSVALDMLSAVGDIELKKLIAQPMTLWIQQADKSYLPVNGYIHTARRLGADGSLNSYQMTFASWMHFLKFRHDMRNWQDKSADEIITDVFNEHPQAKGYFQFALSQPLPQRSYCRQSESDWNFVHRLMEDEGLFGFWQQSKDGKSHTLVITDDIYTLDRMSPETVGFYRSGAASEANAFTQWAASRTLQSSLHTTRTFDYKSPSAPFNPKGTVLPTRSEQGSLPEQAEVYTYTGAYTYAAQDRGEHLSKIRLEEWESRAKRFHGEGGVRAIDAGLRFVLTNHPEHDRDPVSQREFVAIKVSRYIENNLPVSSSESNFPHSLKNQLAQAKNNSSDVRSLTVRHADGSEGFYLVEVEAQRVTVPYRSPFEHRKPEMQMETAIVVGPSGEEVYTDELNRVKVVFIWDRLNPGDERASCWIRVAQSDTGGGYGGVHIPRVGEEVIVGYVGGDCDRPLVLHRVYNGAVKPQWHSNGILSGYRSKEYAGAGFNEIVLDDATGQNRARLFSSSANSLLHLGYLIDQSGNTRGSYLGSGFDLRTDSYGALRANKGLHVTTHTTSVGGQPLDASATQQQLTRAENVVKGLSDASKQRNAESLQPGHDSLTQCSDATRHTASGQSNGGRTAGGGIGSAAAFREPVMLFGSPAGVAVSSEKSVRVTADRNLNFVSGESTYLAAGKSFVASVAEKISLFVQGAGMKLFTGNGKVEIQAQSDGMDLFAEKQLHISSAGEDVLVTAKQKVTVTSGGASITIENGNIEIRCPGKFTVKAASHSFEGPASGDTPLPALPQGDLKVKNVYNLSR